MIRAVLDANVIVSGMVAFPDPSRVLAVILRSWVRGQFELLISDHILDEVIRTAAKPYFSERIDHRLRVRLIEAVSQQATRVQITHPVSGVATHPEDDFVLATAISTGAEYLVTGDRQLQWFSVTAGVTSAKGEKAEVSPIDQAFVARTAPLC